MDERVTRTSLDQTTTERFTSLRHPLGVKSFGINQMVFMPGQRGRIHDHEGQEEVYLVLEGTLTVGVEGEETALPAGELMRIPPGVRRQLSNRTRERVVIVALGGHVAHDHQSRDAQAWTSWDATTSAAPQETPLPEDLPESELS